MIQWELPIPYGAIIRFTTDFITTNKWKEIGEYSKDGINWIKMMETELFKLIE